MEDHYIIGIVLAITQKTPIGWGFYTQCHIESIFLFALFFFLQIDNFIVLSHFLKITGILSVFFFENLVVFSGHPEDALLWERKGADGKGVAGNKGKTKNGRLGREVWGGGGYAKLVGREGEGGRFL